MRDAAGAYDSLAEVYGHGSYAPFTRAMRLAGSARGQLVRFAQPAGDFPDPPTPDFTLALNERGKGCMRFDVGAGRHAVPFRPGDFVLKAPDVATRFAVDAPHQKSFISLPAALVGQLAAEAGTTADFRALHDGAFRAPVLARLMALLWAEPPSASPHGRMFNDGAVLAIVATLLGLAAPRRPAQRTGAALSPARVARVRAFVESRLADSFGIEEMAAAIGLSPWHFARAFREATSQTPRAFVTACRVARAKQWLSEGAMPLAEIAQGCGFADQAHFTTVFGRQTGITPGAFRRGAR